jgi:hypothetical protein
MKLVTVLVLAVSVVLGRSSSAAERTLSWMGDACRNTIRFNPARHNETLLQNTIHLLFGPADFAAPSVFPAFKPADIAKLDLDKVKRECADALDRASQLKFIAIPGIEEYHRASIDVVKDVCEFEAVKIRGYTDPSALREYRPAAACGHFVDALEGKSDIMTVWRETLEENCKRNGSPSQCVSREVANSQWSDGMLWRRLYLMSSWNNCAIRYNIRNADAKRLEQAHAEIEAQFRRLLRVREDQCEPPVDSHPEFGDIAVFETDLAPGTSTSEWNVVAMGLFCGSTKLHPGRIVAYVYGIGNDRLATGQPLAASVEVDGKTTELMLKPYDDVALAPVGADFVRKLSEARTASVLIKDYNSPSADRLKLDDAATKMRSALKKCFPS